MMVIKRVGAKVWLLIACSAVLLFGQSESKTAKTQLTLEECVLRAIKNNLNVAVRVLDPESSALAVSAAKEKFIPSLSLSFRHDKNNEPNYNWMQGGDQTTLTQSNYSASIFQNMPAGGYLNVSLSALSSDQSIRTLTINPSYGGTLSFSIYQPLLKNFGPRISRREILIARNSYKMDENYFTSVLLDTIYQTEDAYWRLYYAVEYLKVQKQSLLQAEELLEKNRKEIAIGTRAPRDILRPEMQVATRRTQVLRAESDLRNADDTLKKLINIEDKEATEIIPMDSPAFEKRAVSLEEALSLARANRPELSNCRIQIENAALDLTYYRNQLLPDLSLNASYVSKGISGTRILYQDDNPLPGVILGKIPGKMIDSLKQAMDFKYRNWSVYFTLEIPLKTVFSRAAAAQAAIERDQAVLSLKKAEQDTLYDIKSALRAIETNAQRVEASRIAGEFARKQLEAEEAKFKAGLSDNFFLLTYQQDLADARITELQAIIDYNLSLFNLDKITGMSLKKRSIRVE